LPARSFFTVHSFSMTLSTAGTSTPPIGVAPIFGLSRPDPGTSPARSFAERHPNAVRIRT